MPKPYTPNDAWSRKAAKEGFRARSVYKLRELDERFGLLKPGMTVLDLGAAPGSWLQEAAAKVGPTGRVIGIDLTPIQPVAANVRTFRADITNAEAVEAILRGEGAETVDLVLSDLAPATSGVKDVDQWRSVELAEAALAIAKRALKPRGFCVIKVFRGADFDEFLAGVRRSWTDVKIVTVKASRDRSREVYVTARKA